MLGFSVEDKNVYCYYNMYVLYGRVVKDERLAFPNATKQMKINNKIYRAFTPDYVGIIHRRVIILCSWAEGTIQ